MGDRFRTAAIGGILIGFPALLCGLGCWPCGVLFAVIGFAVSAFALSGGRENRALAITGLVINLAAGGVSIAGLAYNAHLRRTGVLPERVTFSHGMPAHS